MLAFRGAEMRGHVRNETCIPVEQLCSLLLCDAENGLLYWRERHPGMFEASKGRSAEHICALWNVRYAGKLALHAFSNGYRHGHIGGRIYRAHRVIFAMHYGAWPAHAIDHVNGDKADNRISNLREATRAENALNRGLNRNNTTGCRGVTWVKRKRHWCVRVSDGAGARHTVGYRKSYQDAVQLYKEKAMELHGNYFDDSGVPMSSLTGGDKSGLIAAEKGKALALDARLGRC